MKFSPDLCIADRALIEAVMPLFREYQAHYSSLTSASESQTRAFLIDLVERPDLGFVVVAVTGGRVIGFATAFFTVSGIIAERMLHLGDLFVLPEFRRRSVATRLIDEVARFARARGIRLIRWLSVAANTELNAWYASLGATSGDFRLFLLEAAKRANKAPEPTTTAVTPPAFSPSTE